MDKQQIAIKLIMDELGLPFTLKGFDDRLVFQKTFYLIQEVCLNLGYHFTWYLRGPYSSRLASDGFSIINEICSKHDESKNWTLDQRKKDSLNKIKSFWNVANKEELPHKLELLASVHFLVQKKGLSDTAKIVQTLHNFGKSFSNQEVNKAMKEVADLFSRSSINKRLSKLISSSLDLDRQEEVKFGVGSKSSGEYKLWKRNGQEIPF